MQGTRAEAVKREVVNELQHYYSVSHDRQDSSKLICRCRQCTLVGTLNASGDGTSPMVVALFRHAEEHNSPSPEYRESLNNTDRSNLRITSGIRLG